jgi:hypothetical protein
MRRSTRFRRGIRCRCFVSSATTGVMLLITGCGDSAPATPATPATHATAGRGSAAPHVCTSRAVDQMAQFLAIHTRAIATAASTGNNAMPQCSLTTRLPNDKRIAVLANVDAGPSSYYILDRTITEASQQFTPTRLYPAPLIVFGLGLEAAWFPAEMHLMATDGVRLITTSVDWPGARQKREIALARAVTRAYLRTPRGKSAQALAQGHHSG